MLLDRPGRDDERVCDCPVRPTLGHQREDVALAGCERVGDAVVTTAHQRGDDVRVEHQITRDHALERPSQFLDARDAILQQVRHASPAIAEDVEGVHDIDMLREDEHSDPGELAAHASSGPQSLIHLTWRHPDVDDEDVRAVRVDEPVDLLGVPGLRHDLHVGDGEQGRKAASEERRVVCDDYSQRRHSRPGSGSSGSRASITVPRPGLLVAENDPPSASTRSRSPEIPDPRRSSSRPFPSSRTVTLIASCSRRSTTVADEAPECRATFESASALTK